MGRYAYDRRAVPPFDVDLAAAVVHRNRSVLRVGALVVAVELALVSLTWLLGPAEVRWWVGLGGKGGGTVLWDESVPARDLVLLVLLLTLPGLATTAVAAYRFERRVRGRVSFRGAPPLVSVGVVLTHGLAPSLALSALTAWAGWGEVGALVAGMVPQLGTSVLGAVLLMRHERYDPWAWADPTSRRGREARARWTARRTARPVPVQD